MEITDILTDSLHYPFNHIKSLVIYVVLGFIAAAIFAFTGALAVVSTNSTSIIGSVISIIGLVISVLFFFLIDGYVLDIVKYGINRTDDAPEIDPIRQITNGIKLAITQIAYFIIPVIVTFILTIFVKSWVVYLVGSVLFILFGLIASMAQGRLAKTEELSEAVAVTDAFGDLTSIGIGKVVLTNITIFLVSFVILFILYLIGSIISKNVGSIFMSIGNIFILFFSSRAFGLLYSEA